MDLEDAIVRSITEACEEKRLNATNFVNDGESIRWSSTLGILGNVQYHVPFSRFQESLERGMRDVSILIAFADLITKETNKGMIDNIKEAKNRGSRTYFYMSSSNSDTMRMYVPRANSSRGFTTVPIKFTQSEDGEYEWNIPESAELFVSVCNHEDLESMTPAELSRVISNYTGLEHRESSGVPVLYATQSARDYSMDFETDQSMTGEDPDPVPDTNVQEPDLIILRHQLTGTYPEGLHTQSSNSFGTVGTEYVE